MSKKIMSELRRRLMQMGGDRFPWIEVSGQAISDAINLTLNLDEYYSDNIVRMWRLDTGEEVRRSSGYGWRLDKESHPYKVGIEWVADLNRVNFIFADQPELIRVSGSLFGPIKNTVTNFSGTFLNCTGLKSIPSDLFSGIIDIDKIGECFRGCTGLTGSTPKVDGMELWEKFPKSTHYYCFYGCTGLYNYSEIPDDWITI